MSAGDACSRWCGYCGRCENWTPCNATCSQCGDDFHKGRDDIGSLCDACCDRRDAAAETTDTKTPAA